MKNHVTPETAKKLKEAGFPQPKIDKSEFFGQDDFAIRFLKGAKATVIHNGEYVFVDYDKKEIILLPDAPDILMELGYEYSMFFDDFIAKEYNVKKARKLNFTHPNPAEACAAAWLAKNAKG